jgi:amidohydrolase
MRSFLFTTAAAVAMAGLSPLAAQPLAQAVEAHYKSELKSIFEDIHRNPELSMQEVRTAKLLSDALRKYGYEVTEGVGSTGVVAIMRNGPGPVVMLRADMDALPLQEKSGLPYASTAQQTDLEGIHQHVMHACGHDVHVTALIGAARQLAERKGNWSGTLILIGQPAEEGLGGARAMLEDGLYTRFPKPSHALAFHVKSDRPLGSLEILPGPVSASGDRVQIVVKGVGAHGAFPHKGVDPVLIASQLVVNLQSIVSRNVDPLQASLITVGSIHGGTKANIIGEEVVLELSVRANDPDVREQLHANIERVARGTAATFGAPDNLMPVVTRMGPGTPANINDAGTVALLKARFTDHFGADRLAELPDEGMGSEDFAYFVTRETGVKGAYFIVGGTPPEQLKDAPAHHSPFFKVEPELSVRTGAEAMTLGAMALMPKSSKGRAR